MIITAKFASTCPRCGHPIAAGSRVEWSRGARATHAACPSGAGKARQSAPAATPSIRRASVADAPYQRVEKWEPCRRAALPDTVGDVRVVGAVRRAWATLREGATGETVREGDVLVVVAQSSAYVSADDNEDFGDASGACWMVTLHLRRATEAEAAPALERAAAERARREAVVTRKARVAELEALCGAGMLGSDGAAGRPEGRSVEIDPGVHGSGRRVAILSEDGGAVAVWCSGHYDDYRQSLAISRDPRAVEIALELLGGAAIGGAS